MKSFPVKQGVPGFRFAGQASGIKKSGKDLGLILSDAPCAAAGVFTRNTVKAAPVLVCKKRTAKGTLQSVLVNSGNANACTGARGIRDAERTCAAAAQTLGIRERLVAPCSTGVIGVPLPADTIISALPALAAAAAPGGIPSFAESILTTDTGTKVVSLQESVGGEPVRMCGIAKGAGMIMPNMATMLAFIVTDASVDSALLARLVREQTERTFNRISVDNDMSTNDTVLVMASGRRQRALTGPRSRGCAAFAALLHEVMRRLARMIVVDGEGATKLLQIEVTRARSEADAKKAARQVASSCLVKTAFFGEDFNWGRIMGALGSSGARFDPDRIDIFFNGVQAVKNSAGVQGSIPRLRSIMKKKEIALQIDLKSGSHCCTLTTCDLSYEYVKINADYTT
ncbi:bifunctional glutamate N-acetyltransferase/amino-acid acetyltransferase ArgJ [Thermodesulfobacteriota bacterium]